MDTKPGECKFLIMHTVAEMLEQPEHNEITTALFAAWLSRKIGALRARWVVVRQERPDARSDDTVVAAMGHSFSKMIGLQITGASP